MKRRGTLLLVRILCALTHTLGLTTIFAAAVDIGSERGALARSSVRAEERQDPNSGTLNPGEACCGLKPRAPTQRQAEAIRWSQIDAKAGADYQGEGLAVTRTESGAHLRCIFQRLEAEATSEGLWLTSTVTNPTSERFRVVAQSVGRNVGSVERESVERRALVGHSDALTLHAPPLPATGTVAIDGQTVRFHRPGLIEEDSVSMDGLRQDFIVPEKPPGTGELQVRLDVAGARVEPTAHGAQLVLEYSGRKIAYNRLRATDATGRELPARIELPDKSKIRNLKSEISLAVTVNDANAIYPIRIDPTFSDANWVSLGGTLGANSTVYAAAVDGSGNLYIGGDFTFVGDVLANRIAKWDGSSWSALGSGMDATVYAIAVSGSNVYAGGLFTTAGASAANYVAKWDGSSWSRLGSGMSGQVWALAVWGNEVYAGGGFTAAGGSAAANIAKWNGNSWSALGSGMNSRVYALAASGSDMYAGGWFTTAGGSAANCIAKWNGSTWTALGSGMSSYVYALAVSGSNVYAGGGFTTAGGTTVNGIAKWNGSSWDALGSGMGGPERSVSALAVSGSNVYAGGWFTTAGGSAANYIARWNGSSWSALGSGMNYYVYALAVSGSNVYAGGGFTTAGGSAAKYIAKWNGSSWSALDSGMNSTVDALAVSGSDLYVAGAFTTAGGSAASKIAKWNGSSWSALGSGMNSTVNALAVSDSDLYAGGQFTTAGGKVSGYAARAYLERPTLSILRSGGNATLSWPVFYGGFVLQQNPDAANSTGWSDANYPLATNGANKSATAPITPANLFFRLKEN